MKKRIVMCILMVGFALSLTGCGFIQKNKLEKTGTANAIKYIESKYGFTPKVISAEAQIVDRGPIPTLKIDYNGGVKVELKYDGKDFEVYIEGDEETTDGVDNYQQEEILDSLLNKIQSVKGQYHSYDVSYDCPYLSYECDGDGDKLYANKFFDGSNLNEYVSDIYLDVYYVNNSRATKESDTLVSLFNEGIMYIYNFKSEVLLEEYKNLDYPYDVNDSRIQEYVSSVLIIQDGKQKAYNY